MTAKEFALIWHDDNPWVEVQTSGSTGKPKTLRLSKHDMLMSAEATNAFFGLGKNANYVCPMDFKYIGARMMLVRADVVGGKLIALSPSNQFWFDEVADLLAIVPSQVDCLLASPALIARTRNVIIGGAPLDDERTNALLKAGINAFSTYGMTETASHVALAKVGDSIYHALPGITFKTDGRGCLVINAPGRDNDTIVTNDIAEVLTPTSFLWLGRFDNVINSGGVKIHPEEVEGVVGLALKELKIPFSEVAVTGLPSGKWGCEAACLIATDAIVDVAAVSAKVRPMLSDTKKCPRKWQIVNELPHTANGKIARSKLSELFSQKK